MHHIILNNFSNVLTAVNALLYTYDVLNPDNAGDKGEDLALAILSVASLITPLKELSFGGVSGLTDWDKCKKVLSSFKDFLGGETVQILL